MTKKYFLLCFSLSLLLLTQATFADSLSPHSNLQDPTSFILILLGIIFMLAEFGIPSYGALGIGGLILLIIGLAFLYVNNSPFLQQAWPVILAIIILHVLFLCVVVVMAIKTKQRKEVSGQAALIGQSATVVSNFINNQGWVKLEGELWQAHAEQSLRIGEQVQVINIDGLKLQVKLVNPKD